MKYTKGLRDKIKELEARLEKVYEAGQWGIGHVGMANYAERCEEAEERLEMAMWDDIDGVTHEQR